MIVAVIPARGGSRRIPRKNIRPFNGVPIIARTIDTVRASKVFDRVIVSTDDEEIGELAYRAGAEVPFLRPSELADDHTGTRPVVQHSIGALEGATNEPLDFVACIYPTAVLTQKERYREALSLLRNEGSRFVLTGLRYQHPIERAWKRAVDGHCERLTPEHATTRTQDLEPRYFDAGQFYFGTRGAWRDPSESGGCHMIVLDPWEAVDLDTEKDWIFAEHLATVLHRRNSTPGGFAEPSEVG